MKKILAALLLVGMLLAPAYGQQSGNVAATILPSAVHNTAQISSADQTNCCWNALHVIVNISTWTTGNYTPKIQAKDPVSGNYYDLLVGPALSSTGTTVLKIGAGFVPTANASAADFLPKTWRVQMNGASTPSMTFSVGAFLEQ